MLGQQGHAESADLVGGVAVGRDAVGPHHHALHQALLHQQGAGIVAGHAHVDAVLLQFPGGQARALQEGARLVGDDPHLLARFQGAADDAQGRAVTGRGQGPGIAVGEHGVAVVDAGRPVAADLAADLHVLAAHGLGPPQGPHALHAPAQVHGRGPGRLQTHQGLVIGRAPVGTGRQAAAQFLKGQHAAETGRDADGRSAAHHHHLQGPDGLVQGADGQVVLAPGQGALVQQIQGHGVSVETDMVFHAVLDG